jgi:hypothetical protein
MTSGQDVTLKNASWFTYDGADSIIGLLDGDSRVCVLFGNTTRNYAFVADVVYNNYTIIPVHDEQTKYAALNAYANAYHMFTTKNLIISPIIQNGSLTIILTNSVGVSKPYYLNIYDNDTLLVFTKSAFSDMVNETFYWIGKTEDQLVLVMIPNIMNITTAYVSTLSVDILFTDSCSYAISSATAYIICGFGATGDVQYFELSLDSSFFVAESSRSQLLSIHSFQTDRKRVAAITRDGTFLQS